MEELRRMREELGWTQQRLADESGVDRATISQIEGKRRSPTIATLESLAGALGAEVADFFPKAQAPLPFDDDQRREDTELALAILANSLAAQGEALADELAASDDELPLSQASAFLYDAWALQTLRDKEVPAIQHAARVREALERLKSADRQLTPLIGQWFGPARLTPEQWAERRQFSDRRVKSLRRPGATDGPDVAAQEPR